MALFARHSSCRMSDSAKRVRFFNASRTAAILPIGRLANFSFVSFTPCVAALVAISTRSRSHAECMRSARGAYSPLRNSSSISASVSCLSSRDIDHLFSLVCRASASTPPARHSFLGTSRCSSLGFILLLCVSAAIPATSDFMIVRVDVTDPPSDDLGTVIVEHNAVTAPLAFALAHHSASAQLTTSRSLIKAPQCPCGS